MNEDSRLKIFLVDDDTVYLKSLEIDFLHRGDFSIETFVTGELCVANLSHKPDLVILDYHLDGISRDAINGIETLDKIKAYDPEITVIMLSSQDKIEVAIDCMHHKATDYVVKSETAFVRLQKVISDVFNFKKMEKQLNWYMEKM